MSLFPLKSVGYNDWYEPVDFYSKAQSTAKRYCKEHPEADKDLVYITASHAAERYERSEHLRMKWKLWKWVYICIKNELYLQKRGRTMSAAISEEKIAAIIDDRKNGMSIKKLEEKYEVSHNTVTKYIKAAKETPDSVEAEPSNINNSKTNISQNSEDVKTAHQPLPTDVDMVNEMDYLYSALSEVLGERYGNGYKWLGASASNSAQAAELIYQADGAIFSLKLTIKEN